ncbi:MAG: cytochrome C [Candidatus Binatia bacterium]
MAESSQEQKRPAQVDDKIHTWPHLVRLEFLVAIFVMVVLIIWSVGIDAPLEEPANPTRTPNPSKAPWYFLGLQEMLVYFDPWHAGVVLPSFIIIGLMMIPFIDINAKGNGYYTFKERKYEILTFFLGFHILWVSMIIIGTFFRGPGWNLFWPWDRWDPHKIVALTNVDLPYLLGFRDYVWQSVVGGICVIGYYIVSTWAFYRWVIWVKGKEFMVRWGPVRFHITSFLIVTMVALPVKMFLRLAFNVKYIWVTPWFNV